MCPGGHTHYSKKSCERTIHGKSCCDHDTSRSGCSKYCTKPKPPAPCVATSYTLIDVVADGPVYPTSSYKSQQTNCCAPGMVRCGLAHTEISANGTTTVDWNEADTHGHPITNGASASWMHIGLSHSSTVANPTTITNGKESSD